MIDDPLARALDAYRSERSANPLDTRALERRIVTTLAARRAPARRHRYWAVAIAAALVGPAVLAAAGVPFVGWVDPGQWFPEVPASATRQPAKAISKPAASPAPPPAPAQATKERVEPRVVRADTPRTISVAPPRTRPKHAETRAASSAASRGSPNEELELFRAAQRLQAANGEPHRVLAAWDGYLTRFPHGVLAMEARFNRARSLARLGNHAAAAQEFGHFASGSFGPYRRSQAATLVRVLAPARE